MNKVEIKNFLEQDVRVVNGEWLLLKDFFGALGRLDGGNQITTQDRNKVKDFIELGIICDSISYTIDLGKKRGRGNSSNGSIQTFKCIKLDDANLLLTQFKPTARAGQEALDTWIKFMIFVKDLLSGLEVYKYIITDKEKTKDDVARVMENDGKAVIFHKQINTIMAKVIGVYPEIKSIKKEELKQYENQTTIDLLECRAIVSEKFANAFEFTGSHKTSGEMALKFVCKKYKIDLDL